MKTQTYTCETLRSNPGSILYSSDDWGTVRQKSDLEKLYDTTTFDKYIQLRNNDKLKLDAAHRALSHIPENVSSILDLGGAPYFQLTSIKEFRPELELYGLDYDVATNDMLKSIPELNALISIGNIDLLDSQCTQNFPPCNWIVSFGVDYALTDDSLKTIGKWVLDNNATWLMFSLSLANWKDIVKGMARPYWYKLRGIPLKPHGWARTLSHFESLFNPLQIEVLPSCNNYSVLKISASS